MAQSDIYPETTAHSRNKVLYRYNIHEIQVLDESGEPRTQYEYNEVAIEGSVTKAKVLAAMRAAELEEVGDDEDIVGAVTQYQNAKKNLKATKVKQLSVPEISQIVALILGVLGIEYDGAA